MTHPNPTRRRQERGRSSEQKVLTAARDLLRENGFEDASVAAIVSASGVSNGSFYHHFGSKQGVLQRLIERFCDEGRARFAEMGAGADTFEDRLSACIRAGVGQFRENPKLYQTMAYRVQSEPEIWEPMRDLRKTYEARLNTVLGEDLRARGIADPVEVIALMTQVMLATLTHTVLFSSGPIFMDDPALDARVQKLALAILDAHGAPQTQSLE